MPVTKKKTSNKKSPTKITRIALVLDESGSMDDTQNVKTRQIALKGINEQIRTIKNHNLDSNNKIYVSLIKFNDKASIVFANKNNKELKELSMNDYTPNGGTALRDGVKLAIDTLYEHDTPDTSYLIVAISDGEENSSRLITSENLANLIKSKEETKRFTISYMLSNVDLTKFTKAYGAQQGNIATYDSFTVTGNNSAFLRSAGATSNYLVNCSLNDSGATNSTLSFYSSVDTSGNVILNMDTSN